MLHAVHDWGVPSETFLRSTLAASSATAPLVLCAHSRVADPSVIAIGPLVAGAPLRARSHVTSTILASRAIRASLVHAHFGHWLVEAGRAAAMARRPFVASVHGRDVLVELDDARRDRLIRAQGVVVPSSFLADVVADRGVRDDRIHVIPSGISLADHPFRPRTPPVTGPIELVFIGRFVEKKGASDLLRALERVRLEHPRVHATLVGYGDLEVALRAQAAASGLDVEFVDGRDPAEVRRARDRAHLLVSPSRTAPDGDAETLSMVNLEAQASGLPLVTTRHGGIPSAVTEESAVLAEPGDVASLSVAIGELLRRPDRWPAMLEAGRRNVASNFELGRQVAELEELSLRLIRAASDRRRRTTVGLERTAGTTTRETPTRGAEAHPPVSVIVATYEREALLARCLNHLARQTYPPERMQVVVVVNGSTDGTRTHLAGRSDPWRLDVVHLERNRPPAAARNAGLERADGAIIAFTDDDCRPTETWLETLVGGLSGVDVVQGKTLPDPAQDLTPGSRTQSIRREYGLYETCNIAYRRATIDALSPPGFSLQVPDRIRELLGERVAVHAYGEDVDLAWRARQAGARTRFSSTALVHHHVFRPDRTAAIERALLVAGFPHLARLHPGLRRQFFHRGWFLHPRRPAVWGAIAGIAIARRRPVVGGVLVMTYLHRLDELPGPIGHRARRVAVGAALDAIETASLVYGSWRERTVVL